MEHRLTQHAWFNLGFIPQSVMNDLSLTKDTFYQESLKVILEDVINASSHKDGTSMYIYGVKGTVQCHFQTCLVIGDMMGHDTLCCHYQSYSSKIQRPYRACNVDDSNLDNPFYQCRNVNSDEILSIVSDSIKIRRIGKHGTLSLADEQCKRISQTQTIPAMSLLEYGGRKGGIFECSPPETLHALLLGIIKDCLKCLFNYTICVRSINEVNEDKSSLTSNATEKSSKQRGKKRSKTNIHYTTIFRKKEFNRRIQQISKDYNRQSERELPRAIFNQDNITDLSGINAQEYIGLSVMAIIALPGCIGIKNRFERESIEKEYFLLLWMGVSLYRDIHRYSIRKTTMYRLEMKVRKYIQTFVRVCGDQRKIQSPSVGTKIRKLHSLIHIPKSI